MILRRLSSQVAMRSAGEGAPREARLAESGGF